MKCSKRLHRYPMSKAARTRTRHEPKPMRLIDAVLRNPAADVIPSEEMYALAMRLAFTARRFHGLAVAAPQVGRSLRLVGCCDGMVIANPVIVETGPTLVQKTEGCLSFPGRFWLVQRPVNVVVQACSPLDGEVITFTAAGTDARMWSHEIDHLNGVLLPDGDWSEVPIT